MALAVPPPAPIASPAIAWDWHHPGNPDLTDSAVRAALPDDLRVALSDVRHPFVLGSKGYLDWKEVPGAAAADPPVGISIAQRDFDLLCLTGGISTAWIRAEKDVLAHSCCPDFGVALFETLTRVGGLDVSVKHRNISGLIAAILLAKHACGKDNRLYIMSNLFA